MFRFDKKSFFIAVFIFLVEVIIALFIKDKIIRPFIGDVLVMMLIYYFLKAFLKVRLIYIAVFTLLFSFLVEFLQYFDFVNLIGLGENQFARVVIGTSFSWIDILCYIIGILLLFILDKELKTELNDISRTSTARNFQ